MSSQARRPQLSTELVVEAALSRVAAEGLDRLTMRSVAAELGASTMALYRHVIDRDELIARTVDQVMADLELPSHPAARDVGDWLLEMARRVRTRLLRHPGVADHLLLNGPTGPHGMAFMDRVCHVLADTGRTPLEVARGYDWLMTTVAAYVSKQDRLERHGSGPEAASRFSQRTAAYVAQLPHLREVVHHFNGDFDTAFERSTRAVIKGLLDGEPRVAPHRDPRRTTADPRPGTRSSGRVGRR